VLHPDQFAETDRLAELLDKKLSVVRELYNLARRQSEVIGIGDLTRLMRVLAAKQTLLLELQETEQSLAPYREQDPDQRQWKSDVVRQRARQAAEDCERVLRETMLIERQCETEMITRRDQAAEQLQGAHSATEARRAYGGEHGRDAARLDLTSES